MTDRPKKQRPRKAIAELANALFAAAPSEPRQKPAKAPINAAEANAYLRSLPRVTLEDLERGTA